MSQEGYILITKPSFIEEVCRGWPRNRQDKPSPDAKRVNEVLELVEGAKPICIETAMPRDIRWIVKPSNLIFSGWDLQEFPDEVSYSYHDQGDPCLVYELQDDDFSVALSSVDWADWGKYGDKGTRAADGLNIYWVLYSY